MRLSELITYRRARLAAAFLLGALSLPAAPHAESGLEAKKIQLYVMPDTQSWSWNQGGTTLETWRSVARALCRQRERFAMVLHTGDMVDTPRLRPDEWSNALSVMRELDACRMPYAIAFGNHDFDNYPPQEGEQALAGDRSWRALMTALAHRPAETAPSGRTGIYPLAAGWFVLTVDLHAAPPDLEWIGAEIAERRGARFLLLHHYCVKASGLGSDWCRQLLEQHPEIRIAASGHWLGSGRDGWNEVERLNGRKLIALYQNYQHVPELAAWGVVIELDVGSGDLCTWSENLLDGATRHPTASSDAAGPVVASPARRCFGGVPSAEPPPPQGGAPR